MIRGAVTLLLLAINLLLWGIPVLALGVVKALMPTRASRRRILLILADLVERWSAGNNRIFDRMLHVRWDVEGLPPLARDRRYLIFSNHVSWLDILVVLRVFHRRVALIRFFLKGHDLGLSVRPRP